MGVAFRGIVLGILYLIITTICFITLLSPSPLLKGVSCCVISTLKPKIILKSIGYVQSEFGDDARYSFAVNLFIMPTFVMYSDIILLELEQSI